MDHSVNLVVFTGRNGYVTVGGEDFYFSPTGQGLGKIVSKVIVIGEEIVPVGVVGANPRADAAPIPVCRPRGGSTKHDEEDKERDAASAEARRGLTVLARPQMFQQLGDAPENQQQRPVVHHPVVKRLEGNDSRGAEKEHDANSDQDERADDGTRSRAIVWNLWRSTHGFTCQSSCPEDNGGLADP